MPIISDQMLSPSRIHRIRNQIYNNLVKEKIARGFRSYVLVMRVAGFWPTVDDTLWYKLLTFAFYAFLAILFPLSMFFNVFFAHTIEETMDRLFYVSVVVVVTYKSYIIYKHSDNIRELFRIHTNLLPEHTDHNDRVARVNNRVHLSLFSLYFMTWIAFVYQSVYTQDENTILPSTSHLPFEFARRPEVYGSVLGYQVLSSLLLSVCVASMQDTFYLALINANCGQVRELKERLQNLGTDFVDGENRDLRFYRNLIECCKRYRECSR